MPTVMPPRPADRLDEVPFLAGADPALLARHSRNAVWRNYAPGQVLMDSEDRTTQVHLILSGRVRVLVHSPCGRETILGEQEAGDVLGEIAALDGGPRTARAIAILQSRTCALPAPDFMALVAGSPVVGLRLLRLLAARFRLLNAQRLERDGLSVRLRLCAELLRMSRGRAGGPQAASRIVSPPPPQHELAARIGARREVVSREMAALVRQGVLVRTTGGVVIPRVDVLRALLGAGSDPALHG